MTPISDRYDIGMLRPSKETFILKTTNFKNTFKHIEEAIDHKITIGLIFKSGYGVKTAFTQYSTVLRRKYYFIECTNRQKLKPILVAIINKSYPQQAIVINFSNAINKDLTESICYMVKNGTDKTHLLLIHNAHFFTPGEFTDLSYFLTKVAGLMSVVFSISEDQFAVIKSQGHKYPGYNAFTNLQIKYYLFGPPSPAELYEYCFLRGILFEKEIKSLIEGVTDFHSLKLKIDTLKEKLKSKHGIEL